MTTATMLPIELHVPIATWFKVGGSADRFARPTDADQLRQALELDPDLKVLGDGANLLVDDDGIDSLVVTLEGLNTIEWDAAAGLLTVGAGVNLPKLITQTIRDGLAGLEVLGGIPASLGGALVMNAGGAFGQIADLVERVFALEIGRAHV
jgi:UDP-N-acetylmuramate dehydrogenase